jgi:hypothetical protein
MLGILTTIAPLAMRLLGMYYDRQDEKTAEAEAFFAYLKKASQATTSASLKASAEGQLERLKAKEAADAAPKT